MAAPTVVVVVVAPAAALVAPRPLEQVASPLLLAVVVGAARSRALVEAPARRPLSTDSLRLVVVAVLVLTTLTAAMVVAVVAHAAIPVPALVVPAVKAAMAERLQNRTVLAAAEPVGTVPLVVTAVAPVLAVSVRAALAAAVAAAAATAAVVVQRVRVVVRVGATVPALPAQRVRAVGVEAAGLRIPTRVRPGVPAAVDMFN